MSGRPPRLVLPHCSSDDFEDAFWWEGVSSHNSEHWLLSLLDKLGESSHLAVALQSSPSVRLAEEGCTVNPNMLLLQDPVQCLLDSGGWDAVLMVDGLDNFSAVSAEQGRISGTAVNETFRLDWDKEGKVTSFKFGKIVRNPRRGGRASMLPRTADILVVSPQAGNCFDAAEMIPPVRSSVRLVIMSINPLYAPPTRVMPNFEETLPQRKGLADLKPTDRHKLQRLLFLTQCSLQSAVDLMAPRFVLLFVDGARAIFAEKSIVGHYCTPIPSGEACAPLELLWHRGASCAPAILQLIPTEREEQLKEAEFLAESTWPCEDYVAMDLPEVSLDMLEKPQFLNKDFYADGMPQCRTATSHQVFEPASWPHTPGRQHAIGSRGHCLPKEGVCECFPPWRGARCHRPDLAHASERGEPGGKGHDDLIMVTMASGGRIDELLFVLPNWWDNFNWKWDYPVLVFHQNLTQGDVALVRNASRNRVWFANIDRYFREPEKPPYGPDRLPEAGLRAGYRLMCRFKATYVLDQPALQGSRWMLWMDSDSYFTGQVPHDFAQEMNAAGAIFGYTHTGYEDSPLVKNLFDAALLFEAVELGGSKGRPPAALEEEEGGVPNQARAFAEGFDPPERSQYYERLLTVTSGLDRGQVLPFGTPTWKGKVPLTDFLLLDIASFRTSALRRFTDWIDEWGGWWLYRWGDAAIRGVQAWLMLEAKECLSFADLPYVHQHFCRCGNPDQDCAFLGRGEKLFNWTCQDSTYAKKGQVLRRVAVAG
eukprot:s2133_g4.t1